jgi:hypothetical protein
MKKTIGAVIGIGLLFTAGSERTIKAQASTCSLSGVYTYAYNGSYFDARGDEYGYSEMGRLVSDGNGNFTGVRTTSDGAVITRWVPFSGIYSVNPTDCTGNATLSTGVHVDFVMTNNSQNINFIQTDSGTQIAGTAQRQ